MNEYSVRTTGEQYNHRKSGILEGFDAFVDETSAAGLQAGLVNGDKMIFSDEGENILKNNGLIVDENTTTSSTYDLHNFVLSYYVNIDFYLSSRCINLILVCCFRVQFARSIKNLNQVLWLLILAG